MVTYRCRTPGEAGGEIRIKIEVNIEEIEPFLGRVVLPYRVRSPWFSDRAQVSTFHIDELMATKFRALYQRRKGRDLFDLWHALIGLDVDDEQIVAGLKHYMKADAFTFPQLVQNLKPKLVDRDFAADLQTLVREVPPGYALEAAADVVMERLGVLLRNAPPISEITGGQWRQ
jgi:hypothetical protein